MSDTIFRLWMLCILIAGAGGGYFLVSSTQEQGHAYQAKCKSLGGEPLFNGKYWECFGGKK